MEALGLDIGKLSEDEFNTLISTDWLRPYIHSNRHALGEMARRAFRSYPDVFTYIDYAMSTDSGSRTIGFNFHYFDKRDPTKTRNEHKLLRVSTGLRYGHIANQAVRDMVYIELTARLEQLVVETPDFKQR
ncbi:hypothetical protein HYU06_01360 [Candidatus Woesearchaeota archaeon]|nr:hypothetical protein [Candidatus Woesearchaeota archaeon]